MKRLICSALLRSALLLLLLSSTTGISLAMQPSTPQSDTDTDINLALYQPTTESEYACSTGASCTDDSHLANDGDTTRYHNWDGGYAGSNVWPSTEWWQVDLGATYHLTGFQADWYGWDIIDGGVVGPVAYKYQVLTSDAEDGPFTLAIDQSSNVITGTATIRDDLAVDAQFIRVVITDSQSAKISAREFAVFGHGDSSKVQMSITDTNGVNVSNVSITEFTTPSELNLSIVTDAPANATFLEVYLTVGVPSALPYDYFPLFYVEPNVDPNTALSCDAPYTQGAEYSYRYYQIECSVSISPASSTKTTAPFRLFPHQRGDGIVPITAIVQADGGPISNVTKSWVNLSGQAYKRPLIVIPGISGSYLDQLNADGTTDKNLWLGTNANLTPYQNLSMYPSEMITSVITATDAIRSVAGNDIYGSFIENLQKYGGYVEYDMHNSAKYRSEAGCDTSQIYKDYPPTLFVFPYDWRRDNRINAAELKGYIACAQKFSAEYDPDNPYAAKVDIVAHSMGGLVARRYILDNPGTHHVAHLVTIASPWLGAPKAINVLQTGSFFDDWLQHLLFITKGTLKSIAGSLAGADQLIPSQAYMDLGGPAPLVEYGIEYKNSELFSKLDSLFGKDGIFPGSISNTFHTSDTLHTSEQDDWRQDTSGVQYYHIYGVSVDKKTHEPVTITPEIVWIVDGHFECSSVPDADELSGCSYTEAYSDVSNTYGDQTVPLLSATRKGSANYNAPGATLWQAPLDETGDVGRLNHSGLVANTRVQRYVVNVLPNIFLDAAPTMVGDDAYVSAAKTAGPADVSATTDVISSTLQAHYLLLVGVSSVTVDTSSGAQVVYTEAGQQGYDPNVSGNLSGGAANIAFPASGTYTVTLTTSDTIMLQLSRGIGEDLSRKITYHDLGLPAGAQSRLVFTEQDVGALQYDSAGDGSFTTAISPTFDVSGATAKDGNAPTISFASSGAGAGTTVTITAADAETAVQALYYSLDGSRFQLYTQPLQVDPQVTPVIYAFAQDVAGNRSGRVSYTLGTSAGTPTATPTAPSATPTATVTPPATTPSATPTVVTTPERYQTYMPLIRQ